MERNGLSTRSSLLLIVILIISCVLCLVSAAQEVSVLMTNGDQITGSILEYKDDTLRIQTQHGTLKISEKEIVLVEFVSNSAQVSARAYLHLVKGRQFLELGMESEALEKFTAAILESPRYADAHYELGRFWEKQGQMNEALEYFGRAIDLGLNQPGMAKRFMDVADRYVARGELVDAADTYYRLYLHFPEDTAAEYAIYRAGFLFAEELQDNKKALSALEEAVTAFPENQEIEKGLYEVGRIREEENLPEAAESVLFKLVSDFPTGEWSDDAHYILAKVYHQQRRNEDAMAELVNVIDGSTDTTLVSKAKQMLDECVWVVYDVSDGLPSNDIRSVAADGEYIWVGTSAGVTRFNLATDSFTDEVALRGTEILTLDADTRDLWVGTLDSGVMQYSKMNLTWTALRSEELSNDRASAISAGLDGVWIGTEFGGVYRYSRDSGKWSKYTIFNGLSGDNIVSIASTPNGTWCGVLKNGVCFFDGDTGVWQKDPAMPGGRSITSIASGANYVWFAWYEEFKNGVSKYDASAKSWEEWPPLLEWDTAQDVSSKMINLGANDREMWIGTDNFAAFYDHATSRLSDPLNYPSELAGYVPLRVLVQDNFVWFATSNGLGRLNRKLVGRIEQIKKRSKLTP